MTNAKAISPYIKSNRIAAAGVKGDGISVTGGATYAATVALAGVYRHFFINCGITDGSEMALPHTISAPIAGIHIHPPDILAAKHCLIVAARIGNTIRDAILVTIAYRADVRGFERPDGMKQAFFFQSLSRVGGFGRCDHLKVERAVNCSRQLRVCG